MSSDMANLLLQQKIELVLPNVFDGTWESSFPFVFVTQTFRNGL
jgi:hypothetical protein